jgi:molybdopterin biosynthesis enzyme
MTKKSGVVAVTSLALEAYIARGAGVSVLCKQAFELRAALETAADPKTGADVLLVTGGSSVGDFDFSRDVVAGRELLGHCPTRDRAPRAEGSAAGGRVS